MRESELRLSDLFVLLLRKWRCIVTVGLILALCLGIGAAGLQAMNWSNPEKRAQMQENYEAKLELYQKEAGELEGKIHVSEAQIQVAQEELMQLPDKKANYEKNIAELKAAIENHKNQIAALEQRAEELKENQQEVQNQLELLNVQATIGQNFADMRLRETELATIETELLNLPVKEAELHSTIAKQENSINKLEGQISELKQPSEPSFGIAGCVTRFVKFAVVGGLAGVVLAAVWILFATISRGKLLSAKQAAAFGVAALGAWPGKTKKRFLSCVDRWVIRVTEKTQPDAALVCANIAALGANQRILVCGGAAKSDIDEIAAQLKQKQVGAEVICAGSHLGDAKAVEGLTACDAVVLVEKLYASNLETICDLKERAQKLDKAVLGMVLV